MAKRSSTQTPVQKSESYLLVSRDDASDKIASRIELGNEYIGQARGANNESQLKTIREEFYRWDNYNSDLLKRLFGGDTIQSEYDRSFAFFAVGGHTSFSEDVKDLIADVERKVNRLKDISGRLELYDDPVAKQRFIDSVLITSDVVKEVEKKKVFVVFGHDNDLCNKVELFLHRSGLDPVLLEEQANAGMTVIEKFEQHSNVSFAIILLTPDDIGGKSEMKLQSRARQNVILELGYFMGKLGRDKTAVIYKEGVELPSDILGLGYVSFSSNWDIKLGKELKAAGLL
jgi:hypothetical protein